VGALDGPPLTDSELETIDQDAVDSGINLWERSSSS
jgi:L-glyceraldehyde 3-phosphate reductase